MLTLNEAAKYCLENNFKLKRGESVLIVTDDNKADIAGVFDEEARKLTSEVNLCLIPVAKTNGEEPPEDVAEEMENNDIVLCITTKSLTHTQARINANKAGARVATLPGITKDIIKRTFNVNYLRIQEDALKLAEKIEKGKQMRITTKLGTDISFGIENIEVHGKMSGIISSRGSYANLPDGELFFAPQKGTAKGVYIVDLSQAGVGKLQYPIKIEVLNGYATEIKGKFEDEQKEAEKLSNALKNIGNKDAYNIAEIGIGTNPKAEITGNTLEDEKVAGTCHIALGSNFAFGGDVKVPIHVDGIINKPTIYIDEVKIMEEGRLV